MNGTETVGSENHHYDDLFPPLESESIISSSVCVNVKSKAPKSQSDVKLPPKVRPGDNFGIGTKSNGGMLGGKSVQLIIPYEDRKFQQLDAIRSTTQRNDIHKIANHLSVSIEQIVSKEKSLILTITGNVSENVLKAKAELKKSLSAQDTQTVNIPREFHRFILGPKGQYLREIENSTGTKISIPHASENSIDADNITIIGSMSSIQAAREQLNNIYIENAKKSTEHLKIPRVYYPFVCGFSNEIIEDLRNKFGVLIKIKAQEEVITVQGDKQFVVQTTEQLKNRFEEIKKDCSTLTFTLPKSQHKFVLGVKGSGLVEIFETTGVSVELPSSDSPSEDIVLRGPGQRLGTALSLVVERGSSQKSINVPCMQWLQKHVAGPNRTFLNDLTASVDNKVRIWTNNEDFFTIEGPIKEVEMVCDQLKHKVSSLSAMYTFVEIPTLDNLCGHIVGHKGQHVNRLERDYGVKINVITTTHSESKSEKNKGIVRIEGPIEGVNQSKIEVENLLNKILNETHIELNIDQRFHGLIIGAKGRGIQELRGKYPDVLVTFPDASLNSNVVNLRGPKDQVSGAAKYIEDYYRQQANLEDIYVPISNNLYKQLCTNLGGRVLSSLVAESGGLCKLVPTAKDPTKPQLFIQGPKEEAQKSKNLAQQLASEVGIIFEERIECRQEFHKNMFYRNGKFFHEIHDLTGARLYVPPTGTEDVVESNSVYLLGRKESIQKARKFLQDAIIEWESIVEKVIEIDPKWHSHFFQRRGQLIKDIQQNFSGVTLSFPTRTSQAANLVKIKGPSKSVESALIQVNEIVKSLESQVTITVEIPARYNNLLLGQNGPIHSIQDEYNVMIKFPPFQPNTDQRFNNNNETNTAPPGFEQNLIKITGIIENCEAARDVLISHIPIEEMLPLAQEFHGYLFGNKNQNAIKYSREFNIQLKLPAIAHDSTTQPIDQISVKGTREAINCFKEHLNSLVDKWVEEKQDRIARSFQLEFIVPLSIQNKKFIGRRGKFIQDIQAKYSVIIEIPRKTFKVNSKQENNSPETPPISEPDQSKNEHKFYIRGYEKDVRTAITALEERMELVSKFVLADLSLPHEIHSQLIGRKGVNLQKIIEKYQVEDITFPVVDSVDPDLVTVLGESQSVDQACDELIDQANILMERYEERKLMESKRVNDNMTHSSFQGAPENFITTKSANSKGFHVVGAPWNKPKQQKMPSDNHINGSQQLVSEDNSDLEFKNICNGQMYGDNL